jgi:hypothetical protein
MSGTTFSAIATFAIASPPSRPSEDLICRLATIPRTSPMMMPPLNSVARRAAQTIHGIGRSFAACGPRLSYRVRLPCTCWLAPV